MADNSKMIDDGNADKLIQDYEEYMRMRTGVQENSCEIGIRSKFYIFSEFRIQKFE